MKKERKLKNTHKQRHWITILILLILSILLMMRIFILNGATTINQALTEENILCKVYYITQIIASLAVVIGGVVGIWQYTLTTNAERAKMNVDCIQRAIDLAEYYKNNILNKYLIIHFVYKQSGLLDIVKGIKRNSIVNFDKAELQELLTDSDAKRIETIRNENKFILAVLQAEKIYGLNLEIDKVAYIQKDNDKKEVILSLDKDVIIRKFMGNIVTEILNNLEFFAMHFSHGTADESVVYQSLHQTYLDMIYILYYNIAILNGMENSKYYTNVIDLYKKWSERDKKEKRNKTNSVREHTEKGTVVDRF